MQSLTGGRFVLGLGRGIPQMQDAFGIPRITTSQLEDFAGIMSRSSRTLRKEPGAILRR